MRIFYITPEYIDIDTMQPIDGGLASYLCKITTALAELGNDVNVIVSGSKKEKHLVYQGVRVFFVKPLKKTFLQRICWPFYSKQSRYYNKCENIFRSVSKALKIENAKRRIDIIQYASYLATGKYPEKDIPSCVRISSYAKLWQKYYNCSNPIEIDNEVQQFKNAQFLYGPSQYIADYIEKDLSLSKNIKIIETPFTPYNGEEDFELYNNLISQINHQPYLLFFGTIGLLKGALEIANAAFKILEQFQNLHIVLVGREVSIDGLSPIALIKEKAKNYNRRIIHFDKTTHDKLYPLIRGAKAVLLPSRIDNLPNACIEAMGLKKIVIGSKGASFEQLITDKVNGLLCDANNYQSIIAAVKELMSMSNDEIKKMEKAAYARSETLSLKAIVPQVIAYYEYVIKNWRKENEIFSNRRRWIYRI